MFSRLFHSHKIHLLALLILFTYQNVRFPQPFIYFNKCNPHPFIYLAPVVQKLDNSIHWINLCPVDNAIGFCNHLYAG